MSIAVARGKPRWSVAGDTRRDGPSTDGRAARQQRQGEGRPAVVAQRRQLRVAADQVVVLPPVTLPEMSPPVFPATIVLVRVQRDATRPTSAAARAGGVAETVALMSVVVRVRAHRPPPLPVVTVFPVTVEFVSDIVLDAFSTGRHRPWRPCCR